MFECLVGECWIRGDRCSFPRPRPDDGWLGERTQLTPGYPPFCSENAHDVYRKIIDWRNHLYFPDDVHLSREAEDLVRRMLCEADRRLTVEQLKAHPFFYGVDWGTIRNIDAPFVPHLRSMTDTSYFPTDELEQVPDVPQGADNGPSATKDLAFLGYTWVWSKAGPPSQPRRSGIVVQH